MNTLYSFSVGRLRPLRTFAASAALVCAAALAAASPSQAQVRLSLLTSVDTSATASSANASYIGNNASAVAWDGVNAYLGGYTASTGNVGLVQISNVLTTASIGNAFGQVSAPGSRGITGLAVSNGTLAASLDTGGGSGDSVRAFNTSDNSLRWRIGTSAGDSSRRGIAGISFDPGFNGSSPSAGNIAFLTVGSGRRALLDVNTGAFIYTFANGMVINENPVSTTWRDSAFDPTTGDLYTRESNRLTKATRSGDNNSPAVNGGQSQVLTAFSGVNGSVDNDNLAFLNTGFGNFLIANDRNAPAASPSFFDRVKILDTNGVVQTVDYGTFNPNNGIGAYDFSFDALTSTLAVSDFSNRRLYVFQVASAAPAAGAPEPGSLWLMGSGLSAAAVLVRRKRKG